MTALPIEDIVVDAALVSDVSNAPPCDMGHYSFLTAEYTPCERPAKWIISVRCPECSQAQIGVLVCEPCYDAVIMTADTLKLGFCGHNVTPARSVIVRAERI